MWCVTHMLLALACGVTVADNVVKREIVNEETEGVNTINPLHKIFQGLTEANQDVPKSQSDDEIPVSDKPQITSGVSGPHNAKNKMAVGDLLHAFLQKAKNAREEQNSSDKNEEYREQNHNEMEINSVAINKDEMKFTEYKDNVYGSIGSNEKNNDSVMIINLGGIQGHESTFVSGLDPRKCFIYVVQPGGQPQLLPLNQLHLFSQSNVPKYVVLFGNGQTHLFGNTGLQYLNALLANSVNIPYQPNVGVLHNNVPRALLPLFNVLPNLGVHVINVLPNTWTNGMLPKQSNVHNQGLPIINIFSNIGKPLNLGADIFSPPPSDGVHGNGFPDFLNPWISVINNVTERPVIKPIVITTTSVPDIGKNWMDILQRLPGMSNPDKETPKDNGDLNSLLTILGISKSNNQQSDMTKIPVLEGISATHNDNRLIKPTSSDNDHNGLSTNNDLLLALMKVVIENNKNNEKIIAEEQPKKVPMLASSKNSDSTLINLLVNLISKKTSIISKPDKKEVIDDTISKEGLTETLLQLIGRKQGIMVNSDTEEKENKEELKLSQVLIKLLGGHSNVLLNGKGTNKATGNIDDSESKSLETDVYNILVKILKEHPNIMKESKDVSGKMIMEEDEEKLSYHILQLLGVQAGMRQKEELMKPNINVGSQTVVPNWPVSVSSEGFLPGKVGIDPQYLALLMKTFSAVNFPNNYVQPAVGGNVKYNLPQGFGSQANFPSNYAMTNYLLSHLGCVDEQGYYGMNGMPSNKMLTPNVGASNGQLPLNNWSPYTQMSRNVMPNLLNNIY